MPLRSTLKHTLFGPSGMRPQSIKHGLLKGLRFNLDASNATLHMLGMYEREIAADLASLARQAVCAVDIGANDGWYSLYFASCPNIQSVYAFEPIDRLIQSFRANFQLNEERFGRKVTLIPKLVGNQDNDQWCSIDRFLPNPPGPTLFKIDVEGGEMDVLRGAAGTLAKDGCAIVLETHSVELERDCQQFLSSLGYKTRIVDYGWYRAIFRQGRAMEHNRWMIARRDMKR